MQFFGRGSQLTLLEIYKTARDLLNHTKNQWLDPTKCPGELPDNILAELVDEDIPIEIVLNHAEKKVLLSTVKMPARSWFYDFLRVYTTAPENVNDLYIARFGIEEFEHQ